jgi:hypothetical protein
MTIDRNLLSHTEVARKETASLDTTIDSSKVAETQNVKDSLQHSNQQSK